MSYFERRQSNAARAHPKSKAFILEADLFRTVQRCSQYCGGNRGIHKCRFDIFVACKFADMTRLDSISKQKKKIDSLESNIERVCMHVCKKFDSFDHSTSFSSNSLEF